MTPQRPDFVGSAAPTPISGDALPPPSAGVQQANRKAPVLSENPKAGSLEDPDPSSSALGHKQRPAPWFAGNNSAHLSLSPPQISHILSG